MWWTLHRNHQTFGCFFRFGSQIWIPPTSKPSSKYTNQKRCTHGFIEIPRDLWGVCSLSQTFLIILACNPCFPALKEVALTYLGPSHTSTLCSPPPDYISWAYSPPTKKKIEVSSSCIKNFRSKMIWYDMQKMDIHLENPQLVTMSQPSSIWRTQPWKSPWYQPLETENSWQNRSNFVPWLRPRGMCFFFSLLSGYIKTSSEHPMSSGC